mgnify:CR=1 FL=1
MSDAQAGIDRQVDDGDEELPSLGHLIRTAVAGWVVIVLAALVAGAVSISILRWLPPEYTATMVVGPTARNGSAAAGRGDRPAQPDARRPRA